MHIFDTSAAAFNGIDVVYSEKLVRSDVMIEHYAAAVELGNHVIYR